MAGKGKRLSMVQNIKKPYIKLDNNIPMYESLNSNIITNNKTALINGDKIDNKMLNKEVYEPIDVGETNSQLETLRKFFKKTNDYSKHFFLSPCDCKIYFNSKNFLKFIKQKIEFDIIIFTYKDYDYAALNPMQFGWIKKNNFNKIIKFLHKPKYYENNLELITGFFLLNKNLNYKNLIDDFLKKNISSKKEHSIDMFVDYLNKKNYKIYSLSVENFLCIGTEKEYLIYDYWKKAHREIETQKN